tara:strand:- start:136 stop:363 length:228 start_codon:yes stop_codon:yes gene_type:complete
MSKDKNKCSIYYEKGDKTCVYIEISDLTDCCFEIWDSGGETSSRAKIKIPIKLWNEMLKKWVSDSTKKEEDYEYL